MMTDTAQIYTWNVRLARCTPTFCRIIALFAQRDETITRADLIVQGEWQIAKIVASLLPDHAERIAARIGAIIGVVSVELALTNSVDEHSSVRSGE